MRPEKTEDVRQSKEWGDYLKSLGWKSLYIPCAIRIKKILFFSVIKIQRPRTLSEGILKEIDCIAKKERALLVKVEPSAKKQLKLLGKFKYKKDTWPLSPTKTIIVDLTPPLGEIQKRFSKDTRQKIKKVNKLNLVCKITKLDNEKGLKDFYKLLKITGKKKKFYVPSFKEMKAKSKAFKDKGFIVTSYDKSKPLATAYVLVHINYASYQHAAANREGLKMHGAYSVLWETIKECKRRKLEYLDLEGIYDERFHKTTKKWRNFTIFKKKWGGRILVHPIPTIEYKIPLLNFPKLNKTKRVSRFSEAPIHL